MHHHFLRSIRHALLAAGLAVLSSAAAAKSLNYNLSSSSGGGGSLLFEFDDNLQDGTYFRFGGSAPEFISVVMNDSNLGPGAEVNGWFLNAPNQFASYLTPFYGGIDGYSFTLSNACLTSMTVVSSAFLDFSYTGNAIYSAATLQISGTLYSYDKTGSIDGAPLGISEGGIIDFAPTAVPEPSTAALLLGGLGLAGVAGRRQYR